MGFIPFVSRSKNMYYKYNLTKEQRRRWYNNLAPEEKLRQIGIWMGQKKNPDDLFPEDQAHLDSIREEMTPMLEKYKDKFYNSNIPCDMAVGACSCGAWHNLKEWPKEVRDSIREARK